MLAVRRRGPRGVRLILWCSLLVGNGRAGAVLDESFVALLCGLGTDESR